MMPIVPPIINLESIIPEIIVVITALVVLLLDLVLAKDGGKVYQPMHLTS